MNIKHITERMASVHLGQCAARRGKPCDCGARTQYSNPLEPASLDIEMLADPEIDVKGTADGKPQ